ncbi:MAG: pirin family protein [Deltaproteobacteria bacterium]|nr:pirin family protein [Deltaproteobacteria bacterium]
MPEVLKIRKVIRSKPTLEGAGVHLRRAFGFAEVPLFDPFLLLDDFRGDEPRAYVKGFPWHPHRGIETITYLLRGTVEHGDSLGHSGVIGPGDAQWMTAGSGIVHQEMPKGDADGAMHGFQLWANLPAAQKMTEPRYRDVKSAVVPEIVRPNGTRVRIICGELDGKQGPVRDVKIEPEFLDVTVPAGAEFVHRVRTGHTVFAYVIDGRASFCRERGALAYETEGANYFDFPRSPLVGNTDLVLFGGGEQLVVAAEDVPVRFLLVSGKPLREPVAWYGPIVMNTREELRTAFEEYENGTFLRRGRHP